VVTIGIVVTQQNERIAKEKKVLLKIKKIIDRDIVPYQQVIY
jgi:hypothetical protein